MQSCFVSHRQSCCTGYQPCCWSDLLSLSKAPWLCKFYHPEQCQICDPCVTSTALANGKYATGSNTQLVQWRKLNLVMSVVSGKCHTICGSIKLHCEQTCYHHKLKVDTEFKSIVLNIWNLISYQALETCALLPQKGETGWWTSTLKTQPQEAVEVACRESSGVRVQIKIMNIHYMVQQQPYSSEIHWTQMKGKKHINSYIHKCTAAKGTIKQHST